MPGARTLMSVARSLKFGHARRGSMPEKSMPEASLVIRSVVQIIFTVRCRTNSENSNIFTVKTKIVDDD